MSLVNNSYTNNMSISFKITLNSNPLKTGPVPQNKSTIEILLLLKAVNVYNINGCRC